MSTVRHFTVTGFVIHDDSTLLHWHRKVKMWLPPGGHIDDNEDPVQAVLREIEEETGVQAEVVPTGPLFDLDYPTQVPAPFTIMIEDIHDPVNGYHQHIDMIYFCRLVGAATPLNDGWRWVSKASLTSRKPLRAENGLLEPPPEDVRLLALEAFRVCQ
jgi:8-oxo-dGTP diphosphatase